MSISRAQSSKRKTQSHNLKFKTKNLIILSSCYLVFCRLKPAATVFSKIFVILLFYYFVILPNFVFAASSTIEIFNPQTKKTEKLHLANVDVYNPSIPPLTLRGGGVGLNDKNFQNAAKKKLKSKKKKTSTQILEKQILIGKSWQGRALWAYNFGKGKNRTVYLGGTHAGIERGAVNIVADWLNYLRAHKNIISFSQKIIVIPNLNPDGWANYTRENTHYVDLNRNFSFGWQMWGALWSSRVYGGPKPFSEHESIALRDFLNKEFKYQKAKNPKLIAYHAGTNQVFAPYVDGKLDQESLKFAKFYNAFADYPANYSFDYYRLTGDIPAWTTKTFGARAITVEMGAMEEFEKNKKAMEKVIGY